MIYNTVLTQLLSSYKMKQYAALTDEDKAALLTLKKNFLQSLDVGDTLLGTLFKQNGKLIFQETESKLQFSAALLDGLLETSEENIELEYVVKGIEDGKLQLVFKNTQTVTQPLLSDKVIQELSLPQTFQMKELIQAFTNFELPLERQLLIETYRHFHTTKLPKEVLINLLKHFNLCTQEAFQFIERDIPKPLDQVINQLIEQSIPIVGEDKNLGLKLIQSLIPFIDKEAKPLAEKFYKAYEDGLDSLEKVVDYLQKEKTLYGKKLDKQYLKEKLVVQNQNCLKNLIKVIKEESTLYEQLKMPIKEAEDTIMVWEKLNEEGHYYTFQLFVQLVQAKGEMYFYKPKKKKSDAKEGFYTVIALDMPSLKHIEVHIRQMNKMLEVTLYTQDEEIRGLVDRNLPKLIYLLEDKGYHLSRCSCQLAVKKEYLHKAVETANEFLIRGVDFKI